MRRDFDFLHTERFENFLETPHDTSGTGVAAAVREH